MIMDPAAFGASVRQLCFQLCTLFSSLLVYDMLFSDSETRL